MHLSEFGLKNFRVFKEYLQLELAPISLLTGPNSSGKSSLIKAILLLKDSIKRKKYFDFLMDKDDFQEFPNSIGDFIPIELNFNNKSKHFINDFAHALTKNSGNNELLFTLPFAFPELKKNYNGKLTLIYENKDDHGLLKEFLISNNEADIFKMKISYLKKDKIRARFTINLNYLSEAFEEGNIEFRETNEKKDNIPAKGWDKLNFTISDVDTILFTSTRNSEIDYTLESCLDDFGILHYPYKPEKPFSTDIIGMPFQSLKEKEEYFSTHPEEYLLLKDMDEDFQNKYSDSAKSITITKDYNEHLFGSVEDVLSLAIEDFIKKRNSPSDKITNSHHKFPFSIGQLSQCGLLMSSMIDRAIYFNFKEYYETFESVSYIPNPSIRFERLINVEDTPDLFKLINDYYNIDKIDKSRRKKGWFYRPLQYINVVLKSLDIGDALLIQKVKFYGYEIFIEKDGAKIPLQDLGFGIRKLISIILKISVAVHKYEDGDEEGEGYLPSIIILEEPESNLHPKLQSFLAEIIVWAASIFNVQFIIETHSEYMVRKLQYMVASTDKDYKKLNAKHITIHYFNDSNTIQRTGEQVYELGMRPDGILKRDFGSGFFDESLRLTINLLKLQSQN